MSEIDAVFLDTETTGVSKNDQVIEFALHAALNDFFEDTDYIKQQLINWVTTKNCQLMFFEQRYKPNVDIHPQAYEVHGIDMNMLASCADAETIGFPTTPYAIAHNTAFDKRLLRQTMSFELHGQFDEVKWIDTLTLAKIFDKQTGIGYENHKLDTVITHHYPEIAPLLIEDKHKALGDVVKLMLFLIVLVEQIPSIRTFEQLYNFQQIMKKSK